MVKRCSRAVVSVLILLLIVLNSTSATASKRFKTVIKRNDTVIQMKLTNKNYPTIVFFTGCGECYSPEASRKHI